MWQYICLAVFAVRVLYRDATEQGPAVVAENAEAALFQAIFLGAFIAFVKVTRTFMYDADQLRTDLHKESQTAILLTLCYVMLLHIAIPHRGTSKVLQMRCALVGIFTKTYVHLFGQLEALSVARICFVFMLFGSAMGAEWVLRQNNANTLHFEWKKMWQFISFSAFLTGLAYLVKGYSMLLDDQGHLREGLTQEEQTLVFVTLISMMISVISLVLLFRKCYEANEFLQIRGMLTALFTFAYVVWFDQLDTITTVHVIDVFTMIGIAMGTEWALENKQTLLLYLRKLNNMEDWEESTDSVFREVCRFIECEECSGRNKKREDHKQKLAEEQQPALVKEEEEDHKPTEQKAVEDDDYASVSSSS
jgi:hypothetical protein